MNISIKYLNENKLLRLTFTLISLLSLLLMTLDIFKDLIIGKSITHLICDFYILFSILLLFLFPIYQTKWKESSKDKILINKKLPIVKNKFNEWNLSNAEKQVAELILIGYSYKGIADLLDKSERTVRQQAHSIFTKSGLRSRAMFTGSFIEESNLFA